MSDLFEPGDAVVEEREAQNATDDQEKGHHFRKYLSFKIESGPHHFNVSSVHWVEAVLK